MIWLGKAKDPREVKVIIGNGLLGQINSMPYYYGNLTASSIANAIIDAFPQAFQYSATSSYNTFIVRNDIGNETA